MRGRNSKIEKHLDNPKTSQNEKGRVSVRMPKHLLENIDNLVESGVFESRSEAIRFAIKKEYGITKEQPQNKNGIYRRDRIDGEIENRRQLGDNL